LKSALGEQVESVRPSQRLTESPSCLVRGEHEMSEAMRRMLAAAGRGELPAAKPVLEVNVGHPLLRRLESMGDGEEFGELAQLVFDQAQLGEQGQVANPGAYLQRLNRVLVRLMGPDAGTA
jgi:molecular chaperone HtpG